MIKKFITLILISVGLGFLASRTGFNFQQSLSIAIFSMSVMGTLFFWDFRLSFAFIGTSILLATKTIDLEHLVKYSSLEVILFLVGMMVLVGLLKENGLFSLISKALLNLRHITSRRLIFIISLISALLSASIDEVTSIIFMTAAILEVSDHLEIDPVPLIIMSIFATNIGSFATVLGNPIGILIATKSGLTFEDFIIKAAPVAILCLFISMAICMIWYRRVLNEMDHKIKHFKKSEIEAMRVKEPVSKGLKISLAVFIGTLVVIAMHYRIEKHFGLNPNTILLTVPLFASGLILIWKRHSARARIEKDVEWWTLLFFLLLFAQAGTLKYTQATDVLSKHLINLTGSNVPVLTTAIIWLSTFGSAILDNVVMVAALTPAVLSFKELGLAVQPLWWALLFGGCLGGNITLVGSTANIVALGILEKERKIHITFMRWFGVGLTVGLLTTIIAWAVLLFVPFYH
jgi:Na+/H+ antiporter NhaD/arsenite permease-like protein